MTTQSSEAFPAMNTLRRRIERVACWLPTLTEHEAIFDEWDAALDEFNTIVAAKDEWRDRALRAEQALKALAELADRLYPSGRPEVKP